MAIPIQLQKVKKPVNWTALIVAGALTFLLFGVTYFLFFSPTVGIEALVPTEQKVTAQISTIQLDTRPVVDVFNSGRLKRFAAPPSAGQVGRSNPFISF